MKQSSHPRFVVGLTLLAILCTVALGLQERQSAPLAAYSPVSPVQSAPPTPGWAAPVLGVLQQLGTRTFWLDPWPWIVIGLVGFGVLAWGWIWGAQRMERD
jgi:hypothetical protein